MNQKDQEHDNGREAAERRQIRDAMERLIAGEPVRSDGKLTIKSLAEEAGVKRWLLTHKHKDLQAEFRSRVERQDNTPEAFKKTHSENNVLKDRVRRQMRELNQARIELERYARVVQVLTLDNQRLEQQLRNLASELAVRSTAGEPN